MAWHNWVNLILGLLLIAAPWWVGFTGNAQALWTATIFGILISLFSLVPAFYRVPSEPRA
ncbi:MAG: SPW repeat domain-containing protein [Chloroflexota bacterium]